ncbi:MAG: RNA polymerase sigma factor [Candidatus Rokubacteria bacterium]|nr:RNA polymerase sigma factor [Candidatus Rokubacteria bacterium]
MSDPGAEPQSGQPPDARPPDLQTIYGEFQPKICRYLSRLVGATDAEDLTQEVFVKLSQALSSFRGESSVSTWIYRIATNTALDRLRSPSVQRAARAPLELLPLATEQPLGIEHDLGRKEMNECIRRYIDNLPPPYRSALVLSEDEGLTNQQIADVLGISLETVKIRLHRARSRLRNQLGSGCTFYRDDRNEHACEPKIGGVSPED